MNTNFRGSVGVGPTSFAIWDASAAGVFRLAKLPHLRFKFAFPISLSQILHRVAVELYFVIRVPVSLSRLASHIGSSELLS